MQGRPMSQEFSFNPLVSFAHTQGGAGYDPSSLKNVKNLWIHNQLKARESQFTERKRVTLRLGTWNVNGKKPTDSLLPWLASATPDGQPKPHVEESLVDLYVLGFQELDLTPEALLLGDTSRSAPWEQLILKTLSALGEYELVASKQLVGMLLLVFCRTSLRPHIKDVMCEAAGVGIMGVMGNKGGVAIRMKLYDSTLCFVNSHLNAHFDNIQRRNQDYHDICRRIVFGADNDSYSSGISSLSPPSEQTSAAFTVFDHDLLYWMGDLNYRLNMSDYEVKKNIDLERWDTLFQADQLHQVMKAGHAFGNFVEAPLTFAPTYKYDPGTTVYDTSEKKRTPAWCDRILWLGDNISILNYRRHELLSSDHRPVSGTFAVQAKSIVPSKQNATYQDIVKQLDKMENECLPDACVSPNQLSFDEVRYMVPVTKHVVVENTGQVVARFRFIPKLDESAVSPPWCWISPPFGMLIPNEKMTIEITVRVDSSTAPDLNTKSPKLEDILILHLENGKDYFISLTGTFFPSCFGSYLDHLTRFVGPVRDNKPEPERVLSIPKELWRLVDYIYANGLDTDDLFLQSGSQKEMEQICELLDTGRPFDEYSGSVDSMGEMLVRFLESLADPVIPTAQYSACIQSSGSYAQCKQVAAALPPVHYNVFYYLIAFLRELLKFSDSNKLTVEKLAVVFSSVLIRPPPTFQGPESVLNKKAKVEFIQHFLRRDDLLRIP